MADMMQFPETWEEYEEQYGFTDKEEIYTNGSRLIQSFRVKQWLDHIKPKKGHYIDNGLMWRCSECGCETRIMKKYNVPNFCPACGADMRGEEE